MRQPRLVYLVTHPVSARILLAGQLAFMRSAGFDVTLLSAPGSDLDVVATRERVRVISVPFVREIAALADVRALAAVIRELRTLQPDIVNASTPKAGLLGSLAAAALRTSVRIYLLRGLRLETETGLRQAILSGTERTASRCAHEVIAVSRSLRDAYVGAGLAPAQKVHVLGAGSSNGVDTQRFALTPHLHAEASALRAHHGIEDDAPVIGFIGRLTRDKGIEELLDAFALLRKRYTQARLLIVSADLQDERTPSELRARLASENGVVLVPRIDDVRPYLAAMDVLGFPSYREGYPNVVLEGAALERPAVGFDVTGVRDAIVDGVTGILVRTRTAQSFAEGLEAYLGDPSRRRHDGGQARVRVETELARPRVWQQWLDLYRRRLADRGLPAPT